MLYLEDYLEMIENLPQELRDRFTDMREMDLTVQNNIDTIEKRIRHFFSKCARGELQGQQAEDEYAEVSKEYYKVLEDADEKVQLANQMYDLVDRYLRRLDSELFKFKCELEADHNGITEILEKRSLELEGLSSTNPSNSTTTTPAASNQKENRYFGSIASANLSLNKERYRTKPEKRRNSNASNPPEKRPSTSTSSVSSSSSIGNHATSTIGLPSTTSSLQTTVPYNFQHLAAGNAIAAAASQAIVATQQMQQGRRTASLKASYEAIHGGSVNGAHELLLGRELAGAAHNAIQAIERDGSGFNNPKRHKKKLGLNMPPGSQPSPNITISSSSSSASSTSQPPSSSLSAGGPSSPSVALTESGMVVEQTTDGDWTYDPNEPRYCICNQVSYGDMVACDNEACPFEWFHYPCVGITQSPKGKWYCPKCTASMKRRGVRK